MDSTEMEFRFSNVFWIAIQIIIWRYMIFRVFYLFEIQFIVCVDVDCSETVNSLLKNGSCYFDAGDEIIVTDDSDLYAEYTEMSTYDSIAFKAADNGGYQEPGCVTEWSFVGSYNQ